MIDVAYAMAPPGGSGGGDMNQLIGFLPIVLIFGVFYLLLIRPQQKKAKEHRALIDALKKGDQVVTAAGIYGKVISVDESIVTLEIAPGINIKIGKGYIASLNKQD